MQQRPHIIAHRGVSALYPENTMAAFRAAVDLRVDWIELDVITTADNAIIVSHDTTADRCTDGTGRLKELTLDQVKLLDAGAWFGREFAGERIPLLDEVIALVEPTDVCLSIEIKGATPDEYLANARTVVAYLQGRDFVRRVSIASFDLDCLRMVREMEPLLTVNLDPTPQNGTLSPWELCHQPLRCGANFMSHTYETLTPDIVREARLHGLAVWAWTVNDAAAMERMIDLGVDAILSDDPATLKQLVEAI